MISPVLFSLLITASAFIIGEIRDPLKEIFIEKGLDKFWDRFRGKKEPKLETINDLIEELNNLMKEISTQFSGNVDELLSNALDKLQDSIQIENFQIKTLISESFDELQRYSHSEIKDLRKILDEDNEKILSAVQMRFPKLLQILKTTQEIVVKEHEKTRASFEINLKELKTDLLEFMMPSNLEYSKLLNQAKALGELKKYNKAIQHAKAAYRINTNDPNACIVLGWLYSKIGDFETSEKYFEESLKIDSENLIAKLNLVPLYIRNYKDEEAKEFLKDLVKARPDLSLVHLYLGWFLGFQGQIDKAMKAFDTLLNVLPKKSEYLAWYNKGALLKRAHRYQDAISSFQIAHDLQPNDIDILNNLLDLYTKLNKFSDAEIIVLKLLKIEPDNLELLYKTGMFYALQNDAEKAKRYIDLIFIHHPDSIISFHYGAYIALHISDFITAHDLINKSIKKDPTNVDSYKILGEIWSEKGDHKKAVEAYHQAINLVPTDAELIFAKGYHLALLGDLLNALIEFKEVLKLNPEHINAIKYMGIVYSEQNKYKEAIECFKKITLLDPRHPSVWNNLGIFYMKMDRFQEALDHFLTALLYNPKDQDALHNLKIAGGKLGFDSIEIIRF